VRGTDPEVTIAIPTKNRQDLVRRAVASALGQTFTDIEVVVVDDGSTKPVRLDGIGDERLRVVRHLSSRGLCAARNTGLGAARGRWIAFLDDDDELAPEMVQVSLEVVAHSRMPAPVAAMTGLEILDPSGARAIATELPRPVPLGEPLFRDTPGTLYLPFAATLLVEVEVLRSIGGWDEQLKAWMEDDLLIRLNQVCSIDAAPQVTYRVHNDSGQRLHRDHTAMLAGWERTLAKHPRVFQANPRLYARNLAMVGAVHMRAGSWWPALRSYWSSWRLDPRRPSAARQVVAGAAGPHAYNSYRRARRLIAGMRRGRSGTVHVGSS
jgi:glycosyltransferase involved in cell wall biosynthesis